MHSNLILSFFTIALPGFDRRVLLLSSKEVNFISKEGFVVAGKMTFLDPKIDSD